HHELAPGQTLAYVVIGVAFQGEGDAPRHEGGEALPGGAEEVDADGVVGEAVASVLAGHFRAEDGPHRAVDVADGKADIDLLASLQSGAAERHEGRHIERLLEPVILVDDLAHGYVGPNLGTMEDGGVVEAARLPVLHGSADVEHVGTADHR